MAKFGNEKMYFWMYRNNFIRGNVFSQAVTLSFVIFTNKQKDTIIDLIKNNKSKFKSIEVEKYNLFNQIVDENYYDMSEFFKKYLM